MTNLKPCRKKMIVFACADNEGPDQPVHPSAYQRDLIRRLLSVNVFCSNTYIVKVLKKHNSIIGK